MCGISTIGGHAWQGHAGKSLALQFSPIQESIQGLLAFCNKFLPFSVEVLGLR